MSKAVLLLVLVMVICASAIARPQAFGFGFGNFGHFGNWGPPMIDPLMFGPQNFNHFSSLGGVVSSSSNGQSFISNFGSGTGTKQQAVFISSKFDGDKTKHHIIEYIDGEKVEKEFET